MRKQLASTPLFWRVFWGNAAVLVVVVVVLVFGPLQMSAPLTLTESVSLVAGVALALALTPRAHASGIPALRRAGGPHAPA